MVVEAKAFRRPSLDYDGIGPLIEQEFVAPRRAVAVSGRNPKFLAELAPDPRNSRPHLQTRTGVLLKSSATHLPRIPHLTIPSLGGRCGEQRDWCRRGESNPHEVVNLARF